MTTRYQRALATIILSWVIVALPSSASADAEEPDPDPKIEVGCQLLDCGVRATDRSTLNDSGQRSVRRSSDSGISTREAEFNERARIAAERFDREYAAFLKARAARDTCLRLGRGERCAEPPAPPDPYLLSIGFVSGGGGPPVVQFTPAQAGAIAVARLKLPTVAPGIGPPPDLNRWKMAAVGYPLWLWADGPTQVGPVSDSVGGLSVSLEAEVTSLTFRMGDGTTVDCPGDGNKWTEAVEPGAKALNCGHTYTEPSLPKGNYKVSALTNWAVTWTANGQSGVIDVPAVETTELPVGELQVLVR